MASIEKRTSKVGRTTTWRVRWRTGGAREGAWDGETCDDLTTARHFKALVEAAGGQRPDGQPSCGSAATFRTLVAELQTIPLVRSILEHIATGCSGQRALLRAELIVGQGRR